MQTILVVFNTLLKELLRWESGIKLKQETRRWKSSTFITKASTDKSQYRQDPTQTGYSAIFYQLRLVNNTIQEIMFSAEYSIGPTGMR